MEGQKFSKEGAYPGNPKWEEIVRREISLYRRKDDIRSEFLRDYNRILHCTAYRRLKHKTQVFFATRNDHICTRIEHVSHVASVSYTLAKELGLNTELTNAIATGHDVGHAPFGHEGERILSKIMEEKVGDSFWHEKNSLWFVDRIETLPDPNGKETNLNLTYAVRDGIVCHCGEVDDTAIFPRNEVIDLYKIKKASQYSPFTWEGCVVKIADKISYLGRDIEDALALGILKFSQLRELKKILKDTIKTDLDMREINNTVLMHGFMINLCKASDPEVGIRLSGEYLDLIKAIKVFNYENIYKHERLNYFKAYARLIIESIFNILADFYKGKQTLVKLRESSNTYPLLLNVFNEWLLKYSDAVPPCSRSGDNAFCAKQNKFLNKKIYIIDEEKDYYRAIGDFISGMTDSFAIRVFMEITSF